MPPGKQGMKADGEAEEDRISTAVAQMGSLFGYSLVSVQSIVHFPAADNGLRSGVRTCGFCAACRHVAVLSGRLQKTPDRFPRVVISDGLRIPVVASIRFRRFAAMLA